VIVQLESTSAAYIDAKTTPNIMKLAENGVTFTNHYTVFSETPKATYAIYYSDYLIDLGTTPRLLYGDRVMPQITLPEALRAIGYETSLFHSGFLSYADLRFLFERKGIDQLVDPTQLWDGVDELPWSWGTLEEVAVDALIKWIAARPGRPFFAIYGTTFPHHPYLCPIDDKPYPQTSWADRYRNSLHYVDMNIGTLVRALEQQGLMQNTIIILVGDHGETVSTYPVGHGLAMTPEEMRTPFIISNPRLFPKPLQCNVQTNHLDIAPTVMHLLATEPPKEWLGRNVLAATVEPRTLFLWLKHARARAVIDGEIVYTYEERGSRSKLFQMNSDKLTPLPPEDPRQGMLDRYRERGQLFEKWVTWRHLARAARHDAGTNLPVR
jgi:arylsulfatase A-like enzyme